VQRGHQRYQHRRQQEWRGQERSGKEGVAGQPSPRTRCRDLISEVYCGRDRAKLMSSSLVALQDEALRPGSDRITLRPLGKV